MKTSNVRIYQLNNSTKTRNYRFTGLALLKELGLTVSFDNYHKVYEFEMEMSSDSMNVNLESIYIKFQGRKPEGFNGHSLSVSDLIQVDGDYYYIDDYGFEKIEF